MGAKEKVKEEATTNGVEKRKEAGGAKEGETREVREVTRGAKRRERGGEAREQRWKL